MQYDACRSLTHAGMCVILDVGRVPQQHNSAHVYEYLQQYFVYTRWTINNDTSTWCTWYHYSSTGQPCLPQNITNAFFSPLLSPAVCSDFKYLPSEIKGRALDILHGVLQRTTPLLGGDGAESALAGGGRRSARGAGRGGVGGTAVGEEAAGQLQPQGQAGLSLRNAFKMAVYLLFSAAFPSEECYSSAKQVQSVGLPRALLLSLFSDLLLSAVLCCVLLGYAVLCMLLWIRLSALLCSLPWSGLWSDLVCCTSCRTIRSERPLDSIAAFISQSPRKHVAIPVANTETPALSAVQL